MTHRESRKCRNLFFKQTNFPHDHTANQGEYFKFEIYPRRFLHECRYLLQFPGGFHDGSPKSSAVGGWWRFLLGPRVTQFYSMGPGQLFADCPATSSSLFPSVGGIPPASDVGRRYDASRDLRGERLSNGL